MKSQNGGLDVAQQALPGALWKKQKSGYYCVVGELTIECLEAAGDYMLCPQFTQGERPFRHKEAPDALNPGPFRRWLKAYQARYAKYITAAEAALGAY